MAGQRRTLTVTPRAVARLWLELQGLSLPRTSRKLDRRRFVEHLESTGGLQLDSINVLERAHYLTLWSRFGVYDRRTVDRWTYRSGVAYEYWGHEASILPISHLPIGQRRMRRFPGEWKAASWWKFYATSSVSKGRVLRRLRQEGPLESTDFERRKVEASQSGYFGSDTPLPKEDKRSLNLLWHAGKVAIRDRRHFRRVYDLAERVYPEMPAATPTEFEDSWLLIGLRGNGVAAERHLSNYITGPKLKAPARKRAIARNLKKRRIVELQVDGLRGPFYALPEHLERLEDAPEPVGTTLICPFDSLLWQRKRAEELLDFRYRVEIYIPEPKREFGYYVLPILHNGRLVGRLDPKLHRDRGALEIRGLFLEPEERWNAGLKSGLRDALENLMTFVGASKLELPKAWRRKL